MGNYENGASTRRAIVDACKKLFYEKGYRETSYADICREAHVNRGTIYYHFPTKEAIQLEVQWEYFIECKHIAERYCPDSCYCGILAMGILWAQTKKDPGMRRYARESFRNYPIYTGKKDISYFRHVVHEYQWAPFIERSRISAMSFSTVYGYIASCVLLLCEYPERYDSWELYEHVCRSCLHIWGMEEARIDEIIGVAKMYYDAFPADAWEQAGQQKAEVNSI